MKILSKKIIRDIKFQKGRSLSIVIIIALAMGLYTGILLTYDNAEDSFVQAENDVNLHSARFISSTAVNPNNLNLDQFDQIKAWDTRLALISSIYINNDPETSFTAPLYGIETGQHPSVDDLEIITGNFMDQEDEIMLEQGFLDSQDLDIGDEIVLNFENQEYSFEISAGIFSAEYLYNVNPKTGLPDLTSVAPMWMSLEFLQTVSGFEGINEILVRFDDGIHLNEDKVNDEIDTILTYLHDEINPTFAVIELSDEPDQQMKEGDLGALDDFARVFGGVVLLIALFAIYDNISKLIASQRNYIGTMRALGGSKRKVTLHYTGLAMTLASIGTMIGAILGVIIGYFMVIEYAHIIGIPVPEIRFFWQPIAEGLIIHLSLSFLISILTATRAAGIEPREAMSSAYISQVFRSKPIVERILSRMGKLEPTTAIPVRNIFRNKRKTSLTIFTFAVSIVLMVAALAFVDSFNNAIEVNYEDRQKFDLEIYLAHSMPSTEALEALDEISEITLAEPFVNQLISMNIENSKKSKTTSLYGYLANSKLRTFDLIEGDQDNIVVGTLLADELDLEVGEMIDFLNTSVEVSGIANEMVSESLFMDLSQVQQTFQMQNNITGIVVELQDGTDIDQMREEINAVLPVGVIISTDEIKQSIEYLIQGMFAMIGVMVLIGFLTVALFSFNTIVLEIISRENEFVNLKSLGASSGKIMKIILLQSLFISLGGALVSIPLSILISDQIISAMMSGLMSIDTVITVESFVIGIGSAILASFTGVIAAYRHVKKINLVNAMRNRVSN